MDHLQLYNIESVESAVNFENYRGVDEPCRRILAVARFGYIFFFCYFLKADPYDFDIGLNIIHDRF